MSKSHKIIRIALLVVFPILLILPPYLTYRNCSILYFNPGSESTSCGWPFSVNTLQATDCGPVQVINYLGFSGDALIWLSSIVAWVILFWYLGSVSKTTISKIARVVLLILIPLILLIIPYFSSANCIDTTSLFLGDSVRCGWPFLYETLHIGLAGKWGEINYLGLSADIVAWLAGLALWIAVLRHKAATSCANARVLASTLTPATRSSTFPPNTLTPPRVK